ncbi:MAG: response regulator [Gammaproteobacteria bacterium]|nr:response regulator [Gammaproteobacteria bacterium]
MFNVLVVEDEAELRGVLCTLLRAHGHRCIEAGSSERALIEARSHRPDLMIVDLGLPDRDGATLIREVRRESAVPILVLSARTLETEKIAALDAGADDYVTKPFSAAELMARVRAALRRVTRGGAQQPVLKLGTACVDLDARRAAGAAGPIHLTPIEYRILAALAQRAGLVVPQRQLIGQAWGAERIGDAQNLRFHISRLRQKLEPDASRPRYILTEAGVGYRLVPEAAADLKWSG